MLVVNCPLAYFNHGNVTDNWLRLDEFEFVIGIMSFAKQTQKL